MRTAHNVLGALLLTGCLLTACSEEQAPTAATGTEAAASAPAQATSNPLLAVEHLRQDSHAANVSIVRDDYGVPHIYGKTDADAVFGLLYAQSEDDFPRVERNYIWAMGRLAEVEGEAALFSDLRARLYMTEIEARQAYTRAPDWLKALCIAFADGINFYLRSHPEVTPALITHFEPWMPMYFFEGSIGGDIEQIPLAGITAFYGGDSAPALPPAPSNPEPAGSNGIAIGGELTDSGNTLLLINPHTSFYFRGEVHVVSEEGLNAYGAVTWGQFFVYQGFNEHSGWMHTSTYVDFLDEFVEDVVEHEGRPHYRYGDTLRPVAVDSVSLRYRDGDALKERSFPTYRTHHGPITHSLDGKWVATRINWDPVNALRQSYLRTKQQNHDEFREMMQIRTNSSNNTVYADSSGNIAYYHGNFVPRRNPGFDFSQPVDGSNPATDWQGVHSVEETITLLNPPNHWIQNCNSTPFTAAGKFSPQAQDYPAYMAPDPENFRGLHAAGLLNDIAEGGDDKMSMDELIALAYHPYLPAFALLVPALELAWENNPDAQPQLAPVIALLADWNYTVSAESSAMSLAHFYGMAVLEQRPAESGIDMTSWLQQFAASADPQLQLELLAGVATQLHYDFGHWNIPWGEVNRLQRLDGAIASHFDDTKPSLPVGMASSRWGALAAFGSRAAPNTKRLYGYRGNSFVAVVEFGERVRAKSLLAGGQSGDPGSAHFFDQGQRYVDRQFKQVAFYPEQVNARAVERYQPGQRAEKL